MYAWSTETKAFEETRRLGEFLGRAARSGMVVLLSGNLGAGKTCFAQGVSRGLEIPEHVPVTSPSYSLLNIYSGRLPLYHFDLYRLQRIDDLGDLGFDEFAEGDGLTLVEWADRMRGQLDASLAVRIVQTGEQVRELTFTALDDVGALVVREVEKNWAGLTSNPPETP